MADFTCPECNGTGVYQGLNTVEPCRACGGFKSMGDFSKAVMQAETGGPMDGRLKEIEKPSTIKQFLEDVKAHTSYGQSPSVDVMITWTCQSGPDAEMPKPFDEIMPAEHEELDDGDRITVQIHCDNPRRSFKAVDRFVGRKLFGKPVNTFHLESVYLVDNLPGVFGEMLYLPIASTFAAENRATLSDPCQDMLFIPILED
jgi:hypothetical protein